MRTKVMIAVSVLILGFLGHSIYEKEQLKAHGDTVLLELAPVDPRSLMQGDYMQLGYQLEWYLRGKSHDNYKFLVGRLDQNNVLQFVRCQNGKNVNKGEILLRLRSTGWQSQIMPDSFMFQEGHGKYYENAQYGIFKVDRSGDYILVGLADRDRKIIKVSE